MRVWTGLRTILVAVWIFSPFAWEQLPPEETVQSVQVVAGAENEEIIFTGLDGVQHDHSIHAFIFGPDGKLYFNFGNAGAHLKHPDGSKVVDMWGNTIHGGHPGSKAGTTDKVAYRQGM